MSEFSIQEQPLNIEQTPVGGHIFNNVNRISSAGGGFKIEQGRLELRDENGNIVILLDANANS